MKSHLPMFVCILMAFGMITRAQDNPPPAGETATAQTEMQKWIATTDAQWQAVFKRDVTDLYEAELSKLKLQYLALIEAGIAKTSGAGDLDGALALRNEQKRFGDTHVLLEKDEDSEAASVKQLRAAIRTQLAKLEKDKAARSKTIQAKYDQLLAQAQTQLTQHQRLDDALLVKNKRAEIASAWLGGNPGAVTTEATPRAGKAHGFREKSKPAADDTLATPTGGNLFTNGDFAQGMDGWTASSSENKGSATVDHVELHNGKPSLRLESAEGDITFTSQRVAVKPNTRYQLSGYIKTKDVEGVKSISRAGACLCVTAGYKATKFLVRSEPWTQVTMEYVTGKATVITVGPRLGLYANAIRGTAWFSELSLIELGPAAEPLDEFLGGTKWLWFGRKDQVLEFGKDGKMNFDDWTKKGLVTGWKVTGPNQVTLSILSGRDKMLDATLVFSDDHTSFTGTDFGGKRAIAKSSRAPGGN